MKKVLCFILSLTLILCSALAMAEDDADLGMWQINYFLDEFNDLTDIGYITNTDFIIGTFDNSTSMSQLLYVQFLITEDDVAICLLENGKNIVKNTSNSTPRTFTVKLKVKGEDVEQYTAYMKAGGDRIYLSLIPNVAVTTAFVNNKGVSFSITDDKNPTIRYVFKVEKPDGFLNAFRALYAE